MLDYSTIHDLARQATNEAIRHNLQPAIIDLAIINILERAAAGLSTPGTARLIPFLGDHVPFGWHRVPDTDLLVDSTGHGSENEPALTFGQFARLLRGYLTQPGIYGVAVIEAGEFQVVCNIYRQD